MLSAVLNSKNVVVCFIQEHKTRAFSTLPVDKNGHSRVTAGDMPNVWHPEFSFGRCRPQKRSDCTPGGSVGLIMWTDAGAALHLVFVSTDSPSTLRIHGRCTQAPGCCPIMGSERRVHQVEFQNESRRLTWDP